MVEENKTDLSNGWYYTEKYGDVFINNGLSWIVKRIGDQLKNVTVNISAKDTVKMPLLERRRINLSRQVQRNSARR